MYSNGQQPPVASGQQSAFSHPPHLHSGHNGSNSSPYQSRPSSPYSQNLFAHQMQHTTSGRHGSGGQGSSWSPMANSSNGMKEEGEDSYEDDEEEDEEEDGEEEEEEDVKGANGKKRKRSEDTDNNKAKGQRKGKGATATSTEEVGADGKKPKPSRGAKACTHCRRLKMRCVGAENGPPCERCKHTNNACIFEESHRGKRSGKSQKTEAMAASLRKMEATMNNLIKSLKDPSKVYSQGGGMVTRSPSPQAANRSQNNMGRHFDDRNRNTNQADDRERLERGWPSVDEADELGRAYGAIREGKGTGNAAASPSEAEAQGVFVGRSLRHEPMGIAAASPGGKHIDPKALGNNSRDSNMRTRDLSIPESLGNTSIHHTRFAEPERPARSIRHPSPRLHSLPDNTLNPLGLLAEASLHNSTRSRRLSSRNRASQDDTARIALRATGTLSGSTPGSASSPGGSSHTGVQGALGHSPTGSAKTDLHGDTNADERQNGKVTTVQDEYDEFPGVEKAKEKSGISNLSAAVAAGTPGGIDEEEKYHLGVASETYFKPGPMTILPLRRIVIERELAPELLTQGIITSQEVLELFQIFFHHCSQHVVLLDPDWHTPTMICSRSPFLFTVVCTIAAKFYTKRPELHLKCLQMVRKSAYLIMSRGFKSVEIVQGFMLLTLWNTPAERFEEDKTWLFSGVAIRMATDLNLHRKSVASLPGTHQSDEPTVIEREREIINRERTWLICFSIDRSISGQMGKPWTIREDWIIRNSRHWCLQRLSQPWDLGVCALVELLRLSSRQLDSLYSSTSSISGLNTDLDYCNTLHVFNEQLDEWHAIWKARGFFTSPHDNLRGNVGPADISKEEAAAAENLRSANTPVPPAEDEDHHRRTLHFITKQAPIRYNYAVLILNSFGLQHAVDFPLRSGLDKGLYFTKCLQAAKNIVFAARDGLKPVLAYSPDTIFVIISYACVFLLKLTRPTFTSCVDEESVLAVVTEGADLLESVAMNPTHTPALYASFLRALLQSRLERSATNRSGATTPHRSRAASPTNGQNGDEDVDDTGLAGLEERVEQQHEELLPSSTIMPANVFTSLGRSMGGGNATNLTAEQAALLNNYVDTTRSGAQTPLQPGLTVDQLLNESFWGSLLPPGFGGPLDGLATGSVEMFPSSGPMHSSAQFGGTASMPASNNQTRASTPSMLNTFGPNVSCITSGKGEGSRPISYSKSVSASQVAFDFSAGSLS